jgi:O-methyltransferase
VLGVWLMTFGRRLYVNAKGSVVRLAPTLIHRSPHSVLDPERLYYYLDALWQRRNLDGCVLEVGCWRGGTAAIVDQFLRNTGNDRRYICIDTFSGFVDEQFDADLLNGTPPGNRGVFRANPKAVVRKLLDHWGAPSVELVKGDIVCMPDDDIPVDIAVCLLDVDLEAPVYEGLRRIVPKLVPGGVVLVDDCLETTEWRGARVGYAKYCAETGIREEYAFGLGVLRADDPPGPATMGALA